MNNRRIIETGEIISCCKKCKFFGYKTNKFGLFEGVCYARGYGNLEYMKELDEDTQIHWSCPLPNE